MSYDPERHHRRSIRLPGYDYTQPGAYFVTLCTHQADELFGEVTDDAVVLNALGQIAHEEWVASQTIRREIELDAFVVMPNHVHGILWIMPDAADGPGVGAQVGAQGLAPLPRAAKSLGSMIAGYKAAVTKRINALRDMPGAPVWQRNYYEHVIRNDRTLHAIRQYIQDNPLRWSLDRYHPHPAGPDPLAAEIWRLLRQGGVEGLHEQLSNGGSDQA